MKLISVALVITALGAAAYAQQGGLPGAVNPAAGATAPSPAVTQVFRRGPVTPTVSGSTNFTGAVAVHPGFRTSGGSRMGGASVTFAPGARTAWHSHGLGQLLVVTEGCGWTQVRGGAIERICAGDVVWAAPGQEHWHGATATTGMTHAAVSESGEGANVRWLTPVTDEDYRRGPAQ